LLVVLALAGGCRDQRAACKRRLEPHREALVARCVDEGWTDKRIDCEARAGGSMLGLFCGD